MRAIPPVESPQYQYYSAQCLNKEAFDSVALAHKVVKARKIPSARQVYKCEFCNKWHLGGIDHTRTAKPYRRN